MDDNNVSQQHSLANSEFTEKEIARAIHSIAYRKAYSQRPSVKEKKRVRQQTIAEAVRWVREKRLIEGGR